MADEPLPSSEAYPALADLSVPGEPVAGIQRACSSSSVGKSQATEGSSATRPKRQMKLDAMFSKSGTIPAAKRAKTTSSSQPGVTGGPPSSSPVVGAANRASSLRSIPFNTAKWFNGLPQEQRDLLALEASPTNGIGHTYLRVLHPELTKTYFLDLKRFLASEGVVGDGTAEAAAGKAKVFPPIKDIYTWSRRTPLDRVKVVVIGQDPYHGPGQAHGLCFSVRPGVAIPGSLRNIYSELANEYGTDFTKPTHGSLLSWAASGVLLLNTSLTVRPGQAGSHANKGWEQFTDAVVKVVDKYGGDGTGKGVVFLCWGAWAAKRVAGLSKTKHLILQSAHPSPLSAHRGFLGNNHFKTANAWLKDKYGEAGEVDWCTLLPDGPPAPKPE